MTTRDDDGVAAVEMALVSILLIFLGFALLPVFQMGKAYQHVSSASQGGIRFATSLDANARKHADGVIRRRPTEAEVVSLVRGNANDQTLDVKVLICDYNGNSCKEGDPYAATAGVTLKVVVKKDVDLSLFGSLANSVANLIQVGDFAPKGVVTMVSTASGRQE